MNHRISFIQFNELNFNLVKEYVLKDKSLPNFRSLIRQKEISTKSEDEYKNIEPWIQWVSIHTGMKYEEHKVFRLGDMDNCKISQIFEVLEDEGLKIGAMSPMNTVNRLKRPAFFIPDPWTDTNSDKSLLSKYLTDALRQTVNNNAQNKITFSSILKLLLVGIISIPISIKLQLVSIAISSLKKPWLKAVFLDFYLVGVYCSFLRSKNPDFSTIFLNGMAHLQHHYFLSSINVQSSFKNPSWYVKNSDPIRDSLRYYDKMLGYLNELPYENIIATGLTQIPCEKPIFYYRLNNHENFFRNLQLDFLSITPRMTRDFLVKFTNNTDRDNFKENIKKLTINKIPLFGHVDIREKELFISMDYPYEIKPNDSILSEEGMNINIYDSCSFVAIKNGIHCSSGYLYISQNLPDWSYGDDKHVSNIFHYLVEAYK